MTFQFQIFKAMAAWCACKIKVLLILMREELLQQNATSSWWTYIVTFSSALVISSSSSRNAHGVPLGTWALKLSTNRTFFSNDLKIIILWRFFCPGYTHSFLLWDTRHLSDIWVIASYDPPFVLRPAEVAFIPLYCAIVWPPVQKVMEANFLIQIFHINYQQKAHWLALSLWPATFAKWN